MSNEFERGLSNADKINNSAVYNLLGAVGNPDGWEDNHQQENFESLFSIVEASGKPIKDASCIDVGCGTGDFSTFWKSKGGGQYYGVDIFEPSLRIARGKYPTDRFENKDILEGNSEDQERFDFAFLSGALSVAQDSQDNYLFLQKMIKRLSSTVDVGIAFNYLVKEDYEKDDFLFFYEPQRVVDICREVAPDFEVRTKRNPTRNQEDVYLIRKI